MVTLRGVVTEPKAVRVAHRGHCGQRRLAADAGAEMTAWRIQNTGRIDIAQCREYSCVRGAVGGSAIGASGTTAVEQLVATACSARVAFFEGFIVGRVARIGRFVHHLVSALAQTNFVTRISISRKPICPVIV